MATDIICFTFVKQNNILGGRYLKKINRSALRLLRKSIISEYDRVKRTNSNFGRNVCAEPNYRYICTSDMDVNGRTRAAN